MSNTVIEERVVGLRFDGKDFEKNVKSSMTLLDKLNYGISGLKGAGYQIDFFASKLKGLTLDPIARTANISIGKLMALTAALTGVSNISTEVYNKVTSLIRSMSADQVNAGFDKYSEYTNSMQTIMAATKTEGETDAEGMARVNEEMQKLLWFTDETSYNLTDMTSNVGKFTSQGIGLKESVVAMQGIALWAANAGQKSQAASRAMYNLSQSLGTGSVRLQDWMSIENANMATKEFKELAIQAGIAQGTLKKVGNQIQTLEGTTVSIENFRETLSSNWLNKEALMDVLTQYGKFAEKVRLYTIENDVTASEAIRRLKAEGIEAEYALGAAAFEAGQQATTFVDAIDATKDAVSTQFLRIFQAVFGNYLQAKELWTNFANDLWDVFAGPISNIADAFEYWSSAQNGILRGNFFNEIRMQFLKLQEIAVKIGETFSTVFNKSLEGHIFTVADKIVTLSRTIRSFLNDKVLKNGVIWANLTTFFSGLKSGLNIVKNLLVTIYDRVLSKFTGKADNFIEAITNILAKIGEALTKVDKYIQKTDLFNSIFSNIAKVIDKVFEAFQRVKRVIGETIEKFTNKTEGGWIRSKAGMPSQLTAFADQFIQVSNIANMAGDSMVHVIENITEATTAAVPWFIRVWTWLKNIFNDGKAFFEKVKGWFDGIISGIIKLFSSLMGIEGDSIDKLLNDLSLAEIINNSDSIISFFDNVISKLKDMGTVTAQYFNEHFENVGAVTPFQKFMAIIALSITSALDIFEPVFDRINKLTGSTNLLESLEKITTFVLVLVGVINVFKSLWANKNADALNNKGNIAVTGDLLTDLLHLPQAFSNMLAAIKSMADPLKEYVNEFRKIVAKLFIVGLVIAIIKAIATMTIATLILTLLPWKKLAVVTFLILPSFGGLLVGIISILNTIVDKMSDKKGLVGKVLALGAFMAIVSLAFLEMASAIAILALLPEHDNVKVAGYVFGITILLSGLSIAMMTMADASKNSAQMIAAAAAVYIISKSIINAAKAMKKISDIGDPDKITQSAIVVMAMVALMGVIDFLAANVFKQEQTARAIISLGVSSLLISSSLLIVAAAMEKIGNDVNETRLKQAGQAMLIIFGCLSLFMVGATALSKWVTSGEDSTGQLIILGLLVAAMAGVLAIVGEALANVANTNATGKKIAAIAASLGGVLWAIGLMLILGANMSKQNIGAVAAFGGIISAVLLNVSLIAVAMSKLAKDVDVKALQNAVGAMAAIMGIILGIVAIFGFIGAGLFEKAGSFGKTFSIAVLAVAGILTFILMGLGLAISGTAKLIEQLRALSEMGSEASSRMHNAIGSLVGIIGALFTAIVEGLDEAITNTISHSKLPDILGALFAKIMTTIEKYLPKTKVFLTKLTHTIAAYLKDNHQVIKESIIIILDDLIEILDHLLSDGVPRLLIKIFDLADNLFDAICGRIEKGWTRIKKIINTILNDILIIIIRFRTDLVTVIVGSIAFALLSLKNAAQGFGTTAVEIVALFLIGIATGLELYMPVVIEDLVHAGVTLITALKTAIEEHATELEDSVHFLLDTAFGFMASWVMMAAAENGKLYNLGKQIARGISEGIKAGSGMLGNTVEWLANVHVNRRFAEKEEINSPSKVFEDFGKNLDTGLAKGITNNAGLVQETITNLAGLTNEAFSSTFGDPKELFQGFLTNIIGEVASGIKIEGFDIGNLMSFFTDMNPTITPQLDLSLLEDQAGGIQSIIGQDQLESISGSFTAPNAGLDSVSMQKYLDGMQEQMQSYMDVQAYNNAGNSNINVVLDGDAKKMLKVLKVENNKQTKATNYNQLANA